MTDPSLLSLVLTLRPLRPLTEVPHMGRAAHALLLNAMDWFDPALADELHSGSDLRPFTVSDLIGFPRRLGLDPQRTCILRLTTLTARTTHALLTAIDPVARNEREEPAPLRPGAEVQLGNGLFRIEAAQAGDKPGQGHPFARLTHYEDLSAPWLLGRETPARFVWMQFVSPTMFKMKGRHLPIPLPDYLFGNLLDRWNAYAPVAFPDEAQRYARECLALSSYELRSRGVMLKEGGLRMGAIGRARYVSTSFDRYWMSLIQLLAEYAFFASAGVGTGMGLGQCHKIPAERLPDKTGRRSARAGSPVPIEWGHDDAPGQD
jgi:CRISPR-associated endoribonuclease Cas6